VTGAVRAAVSGRRYRFLAGAVAVGAGVAVLSLAVDLFPSHSANHDEGVYLQQAAMLLDGQLWLTPGSVPLREAFHPWFFVESERGLYPKYSPVPAAVFAAGRLAGGYRLALAGVAAAIVALVDALAAAAFDRPTGVLAAAATAGAPLFLFTSAVFLPYAPTTALNLLFAVAYVRSVRRESHRDAALAGLAAGLAFFARPYTAVLFAAPFIVHALWWLSRAAPGGRRTVTRYVTTAAVGLALVAVTFAYNAAMTGSPLLFPYEAFAPLDGIGFGRRRILGHEVLYTPALALEANAAALWALATDWFVAGPVGTGLALVGVAATVAGVRRRGIDPATPLGGRTLRVLLLGVGVSVIAGNLYFWGTYNLVGDPGVADDGLLAVLGPFYHFDLLLVLSVFGAHGALAGARTLREHARARLPDRHVAVGGVLALAVCLSVAGAAEAAALGPPTERNAAHTDTLTTAYAPFEETDLAGALVFLPPTYGEWRNHPFQWLRNDPGFDGPTVYPLARNPVDDFAVLDAYPDREYYRYRYHGTWTPAPENRVVPVLQRVERRGGDALAARTEVAVPDRVVGASVSVSAGGTVHRYDYEGAPGDTLAVDWTLTPDGIAVGGANLTARGDGGWVPLEGAGEVALAVTITEPSGATLTYREELLVRPDDGGVEALWPPASSVCLLVTDCGLAGTYVPDRPDTRPAGIRMNTTLAGGTR